ncbi:MAG: DUF4982 domain-containing protein [Clostridiales bacterium]|nr:DUF4982 domain-containing protein [Clostridiales bacterium]
MFKQKINENWQVWKDTNPFELVAAVPPDAKTVDLPYDAMLREEQSPDSVNGGATGFLDGGAYKYHKSLWIPEDWKGSRIYLYFEGVYRQASIFVNQSLAGERAFGYSEFIVEIQDYVRFGEENDLLVGVKCGSSNSRWYSGAGIYRNVWLLHGPAVHVEPVSLHMVTEEVQEDGALVQVQASICNDSLTAATVSAQIRMQDPDGQTVACRTFPVRIRGGQQVELRKRFFLEQARLWSDLSPELYTVEVTVDDDVDQVVTGIRKITVDARHGLQVNGRTVKLRGACVHHDQFLLGAEAWEDSEYRRIRRLKEAGFNAVRSAHNHASQAMLDACDRLGVYVMDELVDIWNKAKSTYDYSLDIEGNWEADVRSMVLADRNHPSVVLYSTGNEIFEIATEKGNEMSRAIGDAFHHLDPTRFTTNGINGAFAAGDGLSDIVKDITGHRPGPGDVNVFMAALAMHMPEITQHPIISGILEKLESTMDVLGYNYMTARYLADSGRYPDRVMVGSETYPKQIAENWDVISRCSAVLGDFTWTGWDYMGEVMPPFPNLVSQGGDLSAIGVRRPASFYREIVFGLQKGPVIAVQDPARFGVDRNFGPWQFTDCVFNYTWPGQENQPIMIQVYAGGDEIELLQNGQSLGRKACGKETSFEVQYETTYVPGELVAVAFQNGEEIGRTELATTGPAAALAIACEEGTELCFINMELQDACGRRVFSNAEICLDIEGDAALMGFGSEKARHDHGFEKSSTTLTDGCALAILRKTGSGPVKVKIECCGIKQEAVIL